MNPNDQNLEAQGKEIEKRREETEKEMYDVLKVIFKKPHEALTQEDKGFLQARREYLSKTELKEYEDELKEDLTGTPVVADEVTRNDLNARAVELGVENPDKLPNKQAVIDAISEAEANL